MSFEIHYSKSKKIDLAHLEKQYDNISPKSSIDYNPFHLQSLQNYNPLYSLFFEMTSTNFDSISLNHPRHFIDLNTIFHETTKQKTKDAPVFIKYAPLLDPIHYLIGKYEKQKTLIHHLPTINTTPETHLQKISSPNNSAYIDCFFSYLSSQLYNHHEFIHGIDFYGSYLGIQKKFRMDITDDYEYLQESDFFISKKNKLYEIESSIIPNVEDVIKPKLIFGEECNLEIDFIHDDFVEEENKDVKMEEDLELVYQINNDEEDDIDDSVSSSDNSQENDSSTEEEGEQGENEEGENEEDENENENENEDENEEEWSEMDDSIEPTVVVYIHNLPIQMICLEKCEGTLDSLLENEVLDDAQIASALFQVVMTLAAYQKSFAFTHNDLHTNNIVYITTKMEFIEYEYLQKIFKVPTYGRIYKIIDFGRSIYRFQDKFLCSDSFSTGGDAHTQYNIEPFLQKNKPRLEPNMSFDLCRLGCSLYDFVFENEDEEVIQENKKKWTEIQKLVYKWCTDDNGKNILYKRSGEERYPNFKLYKMIARIVHNHTPENQLDSPLFAAYLQTERKKRKKNTVYMNIDTIPKYYSALPLKN
jgi:hypothetical protein